MANTDTEAEAEAEEAVVKETDPALPSSSSPTKEGGGGDQISAVIGNVGRWQLEKVLLVFLASAPGNIKISTIATIVVIANYRDL